MHYTEVGAYMQCYGDYCRNVAEPASGSNCLAGFTHVSCLSSCRSIRVQVWNRQLELARVPSNGASFSPSAERYFVSFWPHIFAVGENVRPEGSRFHAATGENGRQMTHRVSRVNDTRYAVGILLRYDPAHRQRMSNE